jgi:hypothetical protein
VLAALFTQLRALPQSPAVELLPALAEIETGEITLTDEGATVEFGEAAGAVGDEIVRELEDLPLLASVRSHWPLQVIENSNGVSEEVVEEMVARDIPTDVEWVSPRNYAEAESDAAIRRDDETDEMDAVEQAAEPAPEAKAQPEANAQPEAKAQPEVEVDMQASDEAVAPDSVTPDSVTPDSVTPDSAAGDDTALDDAAEADAA